MKIDRREVLKYMRVKDGGEEYLPIIYEVSAYLLTNINPSKSMGYYQISKTEKGVILTDTGVEFAGKLIKKRLNHSSQVVLIAATLGLETENYLASLGGNMLKTLVADAAMNAMLESYLDETEQSVRKSEEKRGLFVTKRFSAGYGDFSLSAQKDIIKLLNAEKLLGLRLKSSLMLYPNKSVTAVMGIGKKQAINEKNCADCNVKNNCNYIK